MKRRRTLLIKARENPADDDETHLPGLTPEKRTGKHLSMAPGSERSYSLCGMPATRTALEIRKGSKRKLARIKPIGATCSVCQSRAQSDRVIEEMRATMARENRTPPARELRGTDAQKVCYSTKRDAARAFIGANEHITQPWGGLDQVSTGGEFDSINERYGLRGKRAARTLADAIWHALPSRRPFCLDRVDLDALNETAPARELGAFVLPDVAAVAQLEARERPRPTRRERYEGAGFPLTGHECVEEDKSGRTRVACSTHPDAEPTGRVLYRPKVAGGRRPRVYLDEESDPVAMEDTARELRERERHRVGGADTSFEFGGNGNPDRLTVRAKSRTLEGMAKRNRRGQFVKGGRRKARRNPSRRRRHARRNPMAETALLINPSRRRRRRRARSNPRRRRSYRRNPFAGMRRRRRYRRNSGGGVFGAGFTLAHVGGAGLYGAMRNGLRRLYWNSDKTVEERQVSLAKFNKHSPFIKGGLFALGWAIRRFATGKWKDLGEGLMLGGIADGLTTITENFGLTPEERDEKEAKSKLQEALNGAGVLVGRGGLSSVLVERERQLRAAGDDDELDELDPSDAFDGDEDDMFEADEDELY